LGFPARHFGGWLGREGIKALECAPEDGVSKTNE